MDSLNLSRRTCFIKSSVGAWVGRTEQILRGQQDNPSPSYFLFNYKKFFFRPCPTACGILVRPGIKPVPPALGARSLNHWATTGSPLPHRSYIKSIENWLRGDRRPVQGYPVISYRVRTPIYHTFIFLLLKYLHFRDSVPSLVKLGSWIRLPAGPFQHHDSIFSFHVPVKAFKDVKDMIHVTSSEDLFYLCLKVYRTMSRLQFWGKITA